MNKVVIPIFFAGIITALLVAVHLYTENPGGMLLYTPAVGNEPSYTPASQIGFLVVVFPLAIILFIFSLAALVAVRVFGKPWDTTLQNTLILSVGFGILTLATNFTGPLWP